MDSRINPNDFIIGVYVEDLSTKKQSLIITTTDKISRPKIYGDNIVYSLCVTSDRWPDIYMYDLSTSRFKTITTSGAADQPNISGNKIVWRDNRNDKNPDVYMYDLSTSKEQRITTSGKAGSPAIYDNKIVWQDQRNDNWDIYMYDLSTELETQITTESSDAINPVIYGNTIAWQDNRNGMGYLRF
jgi:beta propeller repeat protein